jgi:replicative DNA helicase
VDTLYDLELERAVLGSMLMDNSVIVNVSNYLQPEDFSSETYKSIYRAILSLNTAKRPADIVALCTMGCADPVIIAGLTDVVPSGSNWDFYSKGVKGYAIIRELSNQTRIIQNDINKITKGRDFTSECLGVLESAIKRLAGISNRAGSSTKTKMIRDIMPRVCDRFSEAIKHKGQLWGYDTGFNQLNEYLGGLQPEFYIIGARPGQGKSTLGMNLAINLAKRGYKGVYFQLEMKDEAMVIRSIASESGINANLIKGGYIDTGRPLEKVMRAMDNLAELPIAIEDNIKEIHDIAARIRYLVLCEDYKWVIIDHLAITETRNNKVPRREQFCEISGIFRDLRKELEIPIVGLTQVSRDADKKEPTLANLRESGSFEQDADTVMFINRETDDCKDKDEVPTDLIIAKQRDGATGKIKLLFLPKTVTFIEDNRDKAKNTP